MNGFVYILEDERGKFYVGSTLDVEKRLKQHLMGYTQTTRNMSNPKLVFSQKYDTLEIARIIEKKLKNLKRKDYIRRIVSDGYIKIDA